MDRSRPDGFDEAVGDGVERTLACLGLFDTLVDVTGQGERDQAVDRLHGRLHCRHDAVGTPECDQGEFCAKSDEDDGHHNHHRRTATGSGERGDGHRNNDEAKQNEGTPLVTSYERGLGGDHGHQPEEHHKAPGNLRAATDVHHAQRPYPGKNHHDGGDGKQGKGNALPLAVAR